MMATAPLPYDLAEERHVLGAAMDRQSCRERMLERAVVTDFYGSHHQALFTAIAALHNEGAYLDHDLIVIDLQRQGHAWPDAKADLREIALDALSAPAHLDTVLEYALRRRIILDADLLIKAARDLTMAPDVALDAHRGHLNEYGTLGSSPGDLTVEEFMALPEKPGTVAIPGLLRASDRVIIIASEGVAKSELLRQFAVTVAAGLHPLKFTPIEPVPVLLVDAENPQYQVKARLQYLSSRARTHQRAVIWHEPGGLDLRSRRDRFAFEDVLKRRRPKLVILSPLYKCYFQRSNESDEHVAKEVQQVLDDVRTRFEFALLIEAHAPHEGHGTFEQRPQGSTLWQRWPEYGISLVRDKERDGVLKLGRFRGDRARAEWPDELHRGKVWPWEGYWSKGRLGVVQDADGPVP